MELAARILHAVGLFPCRVVVLRGAPSRKFEAGVVLLAVELVVGDDGAARGDAPRGIAHDGLGGAVGILDLEPRQQRRQPEVHEAARTHGEVASVAEHHAQHVGALLQTIGHVEGDVADNLVVVAPRRIEEVVAYLVAVDEELEALGHLRLVLLALGQRRDRYRIVGDEGWLDQIGLHESVEALFQALALHRVLFHMHVVGFAVRPGFLVALPGEPVHAAGFMRAHGPSMLISLPR